MGQAVGTIVFIIIGLVVVATVGSLLLSVLGLIFGLIPVLIKLAIWAGIIYLGYLLFRKFTRTPAE